MYSIRDFLNDSLKRCPLERLADSLDCLFHRRFTRYFKAEVAGDGIDFCGVERDAATVDGGHQLPGLSHFAGRFGLGLKTFS